MAAKEEVSVKHPDPDVIDFVQVMIDRAKGDRNAALYLAAQNAIRHYDKWQKMERELSELKAGSVNE